MDFAIFRLFIRVSLFVIALRYIDKNTYLKVQYLPHTKYGAIVEIK